MRSKGSLKEDIKTIFSINPYSDFTPTDLFYDLTILYDHGSNKLELTDIRNVLNELKTEGFILIAIEKKFIKRYENMY